ncbi:MAG TPA: hypothetical protein DCQ51_02430 [Planktothrix sp. UBA8407]|jgi:Predicted membrane protein|nr:hypothetical protein [Planktothrix sp. UBA8402]HAO10048.1 hypothetical protein [Planktothrix sp. UBA8407]HBK22379.1 hypothetical protein [Planktothrix sp. UBA10369]
MCAASRSRRTSLLFKPDKFKKQLAKLYAKLADTRTDFLHKLLTQVSWWNLFFFATISIFIAIIFGQIEAGLAEPYSAAESTLNLHTILGWSLSGIIAAITAWRYVL